MKSTLQAITASLRGFAAHQLVRPEAYEAYLKGNYFLLKLWTSGILGLLSPRRRSS